MSAMDRVTELKSDAKGEGPCPVCHRPRTENGCWTIWATELQSSGRWDGRLSFWCKSFPRDREQLAEHLNRYHVRAALSGDTEKGDTLEERPS